ncbi:MAG: hypothetical protein EAZ77_08680 [Nostocales cyanobacterium]|nr:MAG: hypothetical protein EAZ77_08680 [Nostocales cyanobacterium]
MNTEKNTLTTERVAMLITILTIVTQAGLFLVSGGFTVGGRLSDITSEMKILRQEVAASNQIQEYRLDKLEAALIK